MEEKRNKYLYHQKVSDLEIHDRYRDKIIPHKWYILYLKNLMNPRFIRKFFESNGQCLRFIKKHLRGDTLLYMPIKGKELLLYKVKPKHDPNAMKPKYDYPRWVITAQEKKNFRKRQRFNLRKERLGIVRMNIKHNHPKGKIPKEQKRRLRVRKRYKHLMKAKI